MNIPVMRDPTSLGRNVRKDDILHPVECSAGKDQLDVLIPGPVDCGTQGSVTVGGRTGSVVTVLVISYITSTVTMIRGPIFRHRGPGMVNSGRRGSPDHPQPNRDPTLRGSGIPISMLVLTRQSREPMVEPNQKTMLPKAQPGKAEGRLQYIIIKTRVNTLLLAVMVAHMSPNPTWLNRDMWGIQDQD